MIDELVVYVGHLVGGPATLADHYQSLATTDTSQLHLWLTGKDLQYATFAALWGFRGHFSTFLNSFTLD